MFPTAYGDDLAKSAQCQCRVCVPACPADLEIRINILHSSIPDTDVEARPAPSIPAPRGRVADEMTTWNLVASSILRPPAPLCCCIILTLPAVSCVLYASPSDDARFKQYMPNYGDAVRRSCSTRDLQPL